MIDGITFQADESIPPNRFAIMRGGMVAAVGQMQDLSRHYRPGDVVCISEDTYHGLQAQFAKDVTPRKAVPPA